MLAPFRFARPALLAASVALTAPNSHSAAAPQVSRDWNTWDARPIAQPAVRELVVAGILDCDFHLTAVKLAHRLAAKLPEQYTFQDNLTFSTREEYQQWLAASDIRVRFGSPAAEHTSSPFIYRHPPEEFIGGCDEFTELLGSSVGFPFSESPARLPVELRTRKKDEGGELARISKMYAAPKKHSPVQIKAQKYGLISTSNAAAFDLVRDLKGEEWAEQLDDAKQKGIRHILDVRGFNEWNPEVTIPENGVPNKNTPTHSTTTTTTRHGLSVFTHCVCRGGEST